MDKTLAEKAKFLEEMSCYEDTEDGETWSKLASLYERYDMISKVLQNALKREIEDTYQFIVDNYELKEETRTVQHKTKYLVWRTDL